MIIKCQYSKKVVKSLHQRVVLMNAKKKNLERTPDKERFLSTKHDVSDLDDVPEDDDALLVFMLLMKREPRRAKKQPNRKEPFSPVHRYPRSLFQKRDERERERDEKERNSTLSEIAICLSFSPLLFSLWLLFLCTKKNDSNRSKSAYLGDGAVLELAGNSRELRELGGLL